MLKVDAKYHKLYVPRAMWDEICALAFQMTAMKPTTLALSYLRSGHTAQKPLKAVLKEKTIKKTKTLKKDYYLYKYTGNDNFDFDWVTDPEEIEEWKLFCTKMGRVEDFEKCLVDPENKPEDLEALQAYAEGLYHAWKEHLAEYDEERKKWKK